MGQSDEALLLTARPRSLPPDLTVEITRSFSYKLNVGNYESRDFFCSEKAQCSAQDAERTSGLLYQFCKSQVLASVREYLADKAQRDAARAERQERKAS